MNVGRPFWHFESVGMVRLGVVLGERPGEVVVEERQILREQLVHRLDVERFHAADLHPRHQQDGQTPRNFARQPDAGNDAYSGEEAVPGNKKAEEPPAPEPESYEPPDKHVIRVGYFVPTDRQPVRNYEAKIRTIMAVVSDVYQRSLRQHGIRSGGPEWETERGKVVVHLVKGKRDASYYNNAPAYDANEQWRRLNPEIRDQLGNGGPNFVYHIELTEPKPQLTLSLPERVQYVADTLTVPKNNRMAIMIAASRTNFSGDLALEFPGLPAGVKVLPIYDRAELIDRTGTVHDELEPTRYYIEVVLVRDDTDDPWRFRSVSDVRPPPGEEGPDREG